MKLHYLLLEEYHALSHPKTKGICHGVSVRYVEACLTGEEPLFHNRIKQIQDNKEKKAASPQVKMTMILLHFMRPIAIFHSPQYYKKVFAAPVCYNQHNIEELAYYASSAMSLSKGGLKRTSLYVMQQHTVVPQW